MTPKSLSRSDLFLSSSQDPRRNASFTKTNHQNKNSYILRFHRIEFMYTVWVTIILVGMICAGASQTVAARAILQSGFEYPLFLSILYHTGQSLSLITYILVPKSWQMKGTAGHSDGEDEGTTPSSSLHDVEIGVGCRETDANVETDATYIIGSRHGLGPDSRDAAARCIQLIPRWLMPMVSAFFGLTNNALRWASLMFVAASVAEMINSGLELVLSVLAARYLRKRMISISRWAGVGIVTLGVVLVGLVNLLSASSKDEDTSYDSSVREQTIGIALIVGQSFLSILQDIAQEFFFQEAHFPPLLMLGLLGLSALSIALVAYFPLATVLGQGPPTIRSELIDNPQMIGFCIGFVLLNTITDTFNVLAIANTSAMTRVVWRNLRTCLVWMMGLFIFYSSNNPSLGEQWQIPASFYTLGAFGVILGGIWAYYSGG